MFPKIPSTEAIRAWDKFTINSKNISSYELMEQASLAFCNWFKRHYSKNEPISVFCGKGNNGGDGLAIARLLLQNGFTVTLIIFRKQVYLKTTNETSTHSKN